MIEFPNTTSVYKRIPKEAFYKHLTLTKKLKEKFISDVDRIVIENSLTKENLNLIADSEINEIILLAIFLKKQELDIRILEAIARQNPHKLVFLLSFEDRRQLALYYDKVYQTKWKNESEVSLKLQGFSLNDIWNSFIEQIALCEERVKNTDILSVDERLYLQDQILKLEKQIKKIEAAAWKEKQPKKQFELYTRLCEQKQKLEELINGPS